MWMFFHRSKSCNNQISWFWNLSIPLHSQGSSWSWKKTGKYCFLKNIDLSVKNVVLLVWAGYAADVGHASSKWFLRGKFAKCFPKIQSLSLSSFLSLSPVWYYHLSSASAGDLWGRKLPNNCPHWVELGRSGIYCHVEYMMTKEKPQSRRITPLHCSDRDLPTSWPNPRNSLRNVIHSGSQLVAE